MTTRLYLAAILLLCAAGAIAHASRSEQVPPRSPLAMFPAVVADWRLAASPPFEADVVKALGVDDYISRVYTSPVASPVGLYAGFYKSQREGDTMHSPLNCLPGSGWEPVKKNRILIDTGNGVQAEVNEFTIEKGTDRQMVLYWYQSHGRVVASEYWGKVFLVWDALRLNRTDGAMIRLMSPVDGRAPDGEAAASRAVRAFARSIFPTLTSYLPA